MLQNAKLLATMTLPFFRGEPARRITCARRPSSGYRQYIIRAFWGDGYTRLLMPAASIPRSAWGYQ